MTPARRIQAWRKAQAMTVADLAFRSGVPASTLRKLLAERRSMNLRQLERLCLALGRMPGEALGGGKPPKGGIVCKADLGGRPRRRGPSCADVVEAVCKAMRIADVALFLEGCRDRQFSLARVVMAEIIRRDPWLSMTGLAKALGRRPESLWRALRRARRSPKRWRLVEAIVAECRDVLS